MIVLYKILSISPHSREIFNNPINNVVTKLLLFFAFFVLNFPSNAQTTINVPADHSSIQAAINAAANGDIIQVAAGTYTENVVINKSVKLRGARYSVDPRPMANTTRTSNTGETIITGANTGVLFSIVASDIEIDGFKFVHTGTKQNGRADAVGATDLSPAKRTNVSFKNNIIVDGGDEAIQIRSTNDLLIEKNYIVTTWGEGINLCLNRGGSNQKVLNNEIFDSKSGAGAIYLYGIDGVEIAYNLISGGTNGIHLGDSMDPSNFVTNISVHHNDIKSTFPSLASRQYGATIVNSSSSDISILNNNFEHVGGAAPSTQLGLIWIDNNPSNITIKNNLFGLNTTTYTGRFHIRYESTVTNSIDATCNWFGSNKYGDLQTGFQGNVNYIPFLSSGTDNAATIGFDATGACDGYPPVNVFSDNTLSNRLSYHTSIQAAINAASSDNVITVADNTYTENLTIDKNIELRGPNFDKAGTDHSRRSEAILLDGRISITGSNTAKIEGFHIKQTNNVSDVVSVINGNVTINNNIIERNGIATGSITRALVISGGVSPKVITNNYFKGDDSGNLFGGHKTWQTGIYVNGSIGNDITIENNTFEKTRAALNLDDYNSGIKVKNNTFTDNGTHISFGGVSPTSGSFVLEANNFNSTRSAFINLSNVADDFRLDITSSKVTDKAFSALTATELFAVEKLMYHRGRSNRKGLVTYMANNQYVANDSKIQGAIDYSLSGLDHIINLDNGTYREQVSITKDVTILGTSRTGTIIRPAAGDVGNNVVTIALKAADIKLENLTITNSGIAIRADDNSNVNGFKLNQVSILDSRIGLGNFTGGTGTFNDAQITNSLFDFANASYATNGHKAIYLEKANNLVIDNITIQNVGNGSVSTGESGGIDINFKPGDYSNITIKNSTLTNTAIGGPFWDGGNGGAAIQVKASIDGATVSGVLIENNSVNGAWNALQIASNSPSIVRNNVLVGTHRSIVNNGEGVIALTCNWFGTNDVDVINADKLKALKTTASSYFTLASYASDANLTTCVSTCEISATNTDGTLVYLNGGDVRQGSIKFSASEGFDTYTWTACSNGDQNCGVTGGFTPSSSAREVTRNFGQVGVKGVKLVRTIGGATQECYFSFRVVPTISGPASPSGCTALLKRSGSGGGTNQWYKVEDGNEILIDGATADNYSAPANGVYRLKVNGIAGAPFVSPDHTVTGLGGPATHTFTVNGTTVASGYEHTVCQGTPVTLGLSAADGSSYILTRVFNSITKTVGTGPIGSIPTYFPFNADPVENGVYTLNVVTGACTSTSTFTFKVGTTPSIAAKVNGTLIDGDTPLTLDLCEADIVRITDHTATNFNGTELYKLKFTYNNVDPLTGTTNGGTIVLTAAQYRATMIDRDIKIPLDNPNQPGSAIVEVTPVNRLDGNVDCEGETVILTLNVGTKPTLGTTITATPVCENNKSTIALIGMRANTTAAVTYTYTGLGTPITASVTTNASGHGSFQTPELALSNNNAVLSILSIEIDGSSCDRTYDLEDRTTTLVVNAIPTSTLTLNGTALTSESTQTVCQGSAVTIGLSGAVGATYALINKNGNVTVSTATIPKEGIEYTFTAGIEAAGVYELVVTNGDCSSTSTFTLNVTPKPMVTLTLNGNVIASPATQTVCVGEAVNLSMTGTTGDTYTLTRSNNSGTITVGSGSIASEGLNYAFTASLLDIGTYTLVVSRGTCQSTSTFTLLVNPKATINPISNVVTYIGESTPVIPFSSSQPGVTYNWSITNHTILGLSATGTGNPLPAFTANETGTATVTVTPILNGCEGTAITFAIEVTNAPDLTPDIAPIASIAPEQTQIPLGISINNNQPGQSQGLIEVYIVKPSLAFSITFADDNNWTVQDKGHYYLLTSNVPVVQGTPLAINGTINRSAQVASGNYSLTVIIGGESGSELNGNNNHSSVQINVQ